ncbi:peptidase M50 family protein [Streptococcus pneumoniae]|nr:peptidase M50 family protein [Streptococcus pneumoniae]
MTNFQNFPITLNILLFWLLVVIISATIHEFSHAIIANNYQIEIPNCGIMLLLFNLAFFVDLSGVQFLKNKKQFLKIMLAGIASNSILSLTGLLVLLFTSYKLLGLLFFIINLGMIFINSIPFFQYDSGIILRYLNSNNNNLNFQYIVQLLIAFVIIYFPLSQLLQFLTPNIIVRSRRNMFYVNSYVFAYKKEGIMYLRGRSMREIAIEPQISQEFINDLFNSCKELLEIEEVLGSKLTFEL